MLPNGYKFRCTGKKWTANPGVVTNLDLQVPFEREITHVHVFLENQHADDTIKFQIIDKDGVYAPAGTILDEFATDWQVDDEKKDQGLSSAGYPATIFAGVYIRIVYTSANGGGGSVIVRCNYYLHEPPS